MLAEPGLEVVGAPDVLLHHHRPVHLGLLHLRQVHDVVHLAVSIERATVGFQSPLGTVAVDFGRLLLQRDRGLFLFYVYVYVYL